MSAVARNAERPDAGFQQMLPTLQVWRRHFHENPELAFAERRSAEYIAAELKKMGLSPKSGIAGTGVVAIIDSGRPGPVVALRADMDALPIEEQTGLPFAAKAQTTVDGKKISAMHACGHDMHMAMLLGAAQWLSTHRQHFRGQVKLLFQPAEEGLPNTSSGAERMVADGVLDHPKVDAMFGLHVGITPARSGQLSWRSNGIMAAGDSFNIEIKGRQTHGALPWQGNDPIVIAAQTVLALQTIVSRNIDLTRAPAVISVGAIHAGQRGNVIPESVQMNGTIRTFDPAMRQQILQRVRDTAKYIAQASNAEAVVTFDPGYPINWNDPALVQQMAGTLKRVARNGFDENVSASPTSEDFAYYTQRVPSLFFFLGVNGKASSDAQGAWFANHSPRFNPDEEALTTGVEALTQLAVDYLNAKKN
ncbi:amidohydrolase [Pelomonas sp. V22]|uniref:M20 metallopeptidase family protein n=1 Tax=Pelomonas sp. V22 TaxID=2822139 RepID=UPI0024A95570|nr:amidohydrolase [Pelomonas sp. V22]MDI4631982.1 amidohydrolase [Pelomonas sp. V22]